MQLVCPSCQTAFRIDSSALGTEGRTVRCSRCRTSWFAATPTAVTEQAVAQAAASEPTSTQAPAVTARATGPATVVAWEDSTVIDVDSSPPLAPENLRGEESAAAGLPRKRPAEQRSAAKKRQGRPRLIAITTILVSVVFGAIMSRSTVVRAVPDLAGLYTSVGLTVNLRGLEFRHVKTSREMQDGIPVLVIEGEIVNITRQPVELPRLRLAVRGANGRELYSWTTLLHRSVLANGEKISFRSRLASPPAEGRDVSVRFLTRADLTAGTR